MAHKPTDIADPGGTAVLEREPQKKTKKPRKWKVIILNDDFTPMEFVIGILMQYFHKNLDEAQRITLEIHEKGSGIAGVFTWEVADTKVGLIALAARQNEFPLRAIMEPADDEK